MTKEIEQSWDEFLANLSDKDGSDSLEQLKPHLPEPFDILNLFDKQCNIDKACKILFKKELGPLLKLYLSRVDIHELSDKINTHRKNFVRGFGQDKLNHLKLLVRLKIIEQQSKPKKGLLAI